MNVIPTFFPGALIFEPRSCDDKRGFFMETFRDTVCREHGIPPFVQNNQFRSRRGVLRGLHYQLVQPQGTLVRVACGRVFDVDVRRSSPTFGQSIRALLDDEVHRQFYNFSCNFVVLSEEADFVYKCMDCYPPASEAGVALNNSTLGIDWPISQSEVKVSEKGIAFPFLKDKTSRKPPAFELSTT